MGDLTTTSELLFLSATGGSSAGVVQRFTAAGLFLPPRRYPKNLWFVQKFLAFLDYRWLLERLTFHPSLPSVNSLIGRTSAALRLPGKVV
jgi:hypothetical protein